MNYKEITDKLNRIETKVFERENIDKLFSLKTIKEMNDPRYGVDPLYTKFVRNNILNHSIEYEL